MASIAIIDDFAPFHSDPKTEKSEYYTTRLGDLAAGIGMPMLTEYLLFLRAHPELDEDEKAARLISQIRAEIDLMLSDNFYSKRSNHLIGLDTGALHALLHFPELDKNGDNALAFTRPDRHAAQSL